MSRLLSVDEALTLVLARVPPPVRDAFDAPIDRSIGRVLYEEVRADADYPAWPRSRVDGYAVRAAETPGAFEIACEVPAGRAPGDRLASGQSARVFTGAPVPEDADAVVKQEDVLVEAGRVVLSARVGAGENVTPRGSECLSGLVVGARGDLVTPALSGALASVGAATVAVARRPWVAVLPTGSEVVPIGQSPPPGCIRNSNAPALVAAMQSYGAVANVSPIAPDSRPALDDALETVFGENRSLSILLLTGGVSVGDYDLVPAALIDAGVERVFHGVNLQPGKPLWFGVRGRTLVFGLPGNPVSALVNAALFVGPAVRKLLGRTDVVTPPSVAHLGGDVGRGASRRRYVPARTHIDPDGRLVATPVPFAGSGDVFGFSRADALIVVPEDSPARAAGERAEVVSLSGSGR